MDRRGWIFRGGIAVRTATAAATRNHDERAPQNGGQSYKQGSHWAPVGEGRETGEGVTSMVQLSLALSVPVAVMVVDPEPSVVMYRTEKSPLGCVATVAPGAATWALLPPVLPIMRMLVIAMFGGSSSVMVTVAVVDPRTVAPVGEVSVTVNDEGG